MQDRPTAVELLRAAQEFCERELIPQLSGRVAFHARVLQNVLAILEREWEGEEAALRAEWQRLGALLGDAGTPPTGKTELAERVKEMNTELAGRIRSGEFDERSEQTIEALYRSVVEKLAIANPRWADPPSGGKS